MKMMTSQMSGQTGTNDLVQRIKIHMFTQNTSMNNHMEVFFMSEKNDEKQKELDRREQENKEIKETGEVTLDQNRRNHKIELLDDHR